MEMKLENTKNKDPKGNQGEKSVAYKETNWVPSAVQPQQQFEDRMVAIEIIAQVYGIIVL